MRFENFLSLLAFSLVICALASSIGCHHPLIYNKNINGAPTIDPAIYTVSEYNADKANYDAATNAAALNMDAAKLKRNAIVWGLMTDTEIVYNARYKSLFGGKNFTAVVGDGLTLGLGSAGTIATNAATKTIFAALNTGISGLNVQFFVLFGQVTYPDYNQFMVARTLGLIAHKLQNANYGQCPLSATAANPLPRADMTGCA